MSNMNKTIKLTYSVDGYVNSGLILDGYTQSANFYTSPINVRNVDTWSMLLMLPSTGTPSGTLQIQVSDDLGKYENTAGPGNMCDPGVSNWFNKYVWNAASNSWINSLTVSGATNVFLEEYKCTYRWVRFFWTNTSGSMTPVSFHFQYKGLTI